MLYVFQTSVCDCLRGIHFDMASEKTNSARATGLIERVYNVSREKKARWEAVIFVEL